MNRARMIDIDLIHAVPYAAFENILHGVGMLYHGIPHKRTAFQLAGAIMDEYGITGRYARADRECILGITLDAGIGAFKSGPGINDFGMPVRAVGIMIAVQDFFLNPFNGFFPERFRYSR